MYSGYYSVERIAKMLDIHPKTVQRYIREGKLRAAKIGKSWRVNGHDLSAFTEKANISPEKKERSVSEEERVKASSVIDIDVDSRDEAIRIVNTLTAAMNAKPAGYGQSSMHAQILEPDLKVRITLWGGLKFMTVILSAIEAATDQYGE